MEKLNPSLYPNFEYLRNDTLPFELHKNEKYRQVGIMVPPTGLEVSDSVLSDVLVDAVKEGITEIILDVSKQPHEIGRSYAARISKQANMKRMGKVVTFGLDPKAVDFQYPTAATLEDAVQILLK